jgi:hypothetical protein
MTAEPTEELKISLHPSDDDMMPIELTFSPQDAKYVISTRPLRLEDTDRSRIRWYFEEYPRFQHDPAPMIAHEIEDRIAELGNFWFASVFQASTDNWSLWGKIREITARLRIVIEDSTPEDKAIIWELLRTPEGYPLALLADEFVHSPLESTPTRTLPPLGNMRVLLVIARPNGSEDIGLRAVAGDIVEMLSASARASIEILRPPTFDMLVTTLTDAAQSEPFTVVHFDGHGIWTDLDAEASGLATGSPRGYVLFEGPGRRPEAVSGKQLGLCLSRAGVRALVLNACRSAHVALSPAGIGHGNAQAAARVSSFAMDVARAGVPGVVGLRYDVTVDTAAQLTARIYEGLLSGESLARAVRLARSQLLLESEENRAFLQIGRTDWALPVVFEAQHVQVLAEE